MAIETIDPRIYSRDTDKDSLEVTFKKINDNFVELDGRSGGGSGIEILNSDPISPTIGQSWVTEYNTTDGEVIGLGLLFTYVEPTTLEAHYKIKGTNEILIIN